MPNGPSVPSDTDTTEGTPPPEPAPSITGRQAGARRAPLQKKLEEFFGTPALAYSFMGDQYGAELLAQRTPAMAEAWYDLSTKNAGVRRVLERLVEGGAWGAVVLSTASVLVPLAQHHGLIPGSDPFATLFPPLPPSTGQSGNGSVRPIVPPPPGKESKAAGVEGAPVTTVPGSPPGVVTVASGSNRAA